MDLVYFLKRRTAFIRSFYSEGRKPFDEIKRLIEDDLPPYDNPPFDPDQYDGEPPYLEEWMEAEMAIHVLGLSCVSMLSDTLKIYFKTLEREFGFSPTDEIIKKVFKPEGFLNGYKIILAEIVDTDWSDCPVDFAIVEQIVLARNRGQHGADIHSFRVSHDAKTAEKHPRLFFVSEDEKDVEHGPEDGSISWFGPEIAVSQSDLERAISEVENLAEWISAREDKARDWRRGLR